MSAPDSLTKETGVMQASASMLGRKLALLKLLADAYGETETATALARPRVLSALVDCANALIYYRDECSGHEPSLSVFHRKLDEALTQLDSI